MSIRVAGLLAALGGLLLLWLEVAVLYLWVVPTERSFSSFVISEAAASGASLFFWWQAKEGRGRSTLTWLLALPVAAVISLVFLEIDCFGSLHLVAGLPTCSDFHGNITLVLTLGAIALTVAALPNALRAWLRAKFANDQSGT